MEPKRDGLQQTATPPPAAAAADPRPEIASTGPRLPEIPSRGTPPGGAGNGERARGCRDCPGEGGRKTTAAIPAGGWNKSRILCSSAAFGGYGTVARSVAFGGEGRVALLLGSRGVERYRRAGGRGRLV